MYANLAKTFLGDLLQGLETHSLSGAVQMGETCCVQQCLTMFDQHT